MSAIEYNGPNNLNKSGANLLCKKIERYWKVRGYAGIKTHIEQCSTAGADGVESILHFVRSNIGANGYPPKNAELVAA